MKTGTETKLVHEGQYVAELAVELPGSDEGRARPRR